jgi:hypothetical protein
MQRRSNVRMSNEDLAKQTRFLKKSKALLEMRISPDKSMRIGALFINLGWEMLKSTRINIWLLLS